MRNASTMDPAESAVAENTSPRWLISKWSSYGIVFFEVLAPVRNVGEKFAQTVRPRRGRWLEPGPLEKDEKIDLFQDFPCMLPKNTHLM